MVTFALLFHREIGCRDNPFHRIKKKRSLMRSLFLLLLLKYLVVYKSAGFRAYDSHAVSHFTGEMVERNASMVSLYSGVYVRVNIYMTLPSI